MKRFREVPDADVRAALQVRHRTCHSQNPVTSSGAESETADGPSQQGFAFRIQTALASNLTRAEIGIAGREIRIRPGQFSGPVQGPIPCLHHASTPLGGRVTRSGIASKVGPLHGRNLEPDIESIQQRPTDA